MLPNAMVETDTVSGSENLVAKKKVGTGSKENRLHPNRVGRNEQGLGCSIIQNPKKPQAPAQDNMWWNL